MKQILKEPQFRLLREIVGGRCPQLLSRVESADISDLSQEERRIIVGALGNEFAASGTGKDWEPTQRGLQIEELLDLVNRPNLGLKPPTNS
jgi:hypothetical protein